VSKLEFQVMQLTMEGSRTTGLLHALTKDPLPGWYHHDWHVGTIHSPHIEL
jgi:hypothetical protein